jgi:hypothetical protein
VEAGCVKGNTEEVRRINTYLDLLRSKVYAYQQELLQEGKLVTLLPNHRQGRRGGNF